MNGLSGGADFPYKSVLLSTQDLPFKTGSTNSGLNYLTIAYDL